MTKWCETCGAFVCKPNRHAAWHLDVRASSEPITGATFARNQAYLDAIERADHAEADRDRAHKVIKRMEAELAALRNAKLDCRDQLWEACGSNDYDDNSWAHGLEMVRAMRKELDRTVEIRQAEFERSYSDLQDQVRSLKLKVARQAPECPAGEAR